MTAFPRSAGALPRTVTPPKFPTGLQSWGASGKGQQRSVKNMGRTWDEVYPLMDTQNPSMRAFVELINRSLRNGLIWDVQHPYWNQRKVVNWAQFSQKFNTSPWGKTGLTSVNETATTAVDGRTTGNLFTEDSSTGNHEVHQNVTITPGEFLGISVYVKSSGTRTQGDFIVQGSPTSSDWFGLSFDLTAGTVANYFGGNGKIAGITIVSLPNGWFWIAAWGQVSPVSTDTVGVFKLRLRSAGAPSYTGDGASGMYWWQSDFARNGTGGVVVPQLGTWILTTGSTSLGSPTTFSQRQIIQAPEDFSQWNNIGTPTIATGQADPYGTSNATLIGDDDAASMEGKQLPTALIPFTGDGIKTIAWFAKANTAPDNLIELRDQTAGVNRISVTVTWQLGVPVLSAVTGVVLRVIPWGSGWWRFLVQSTTVTAANTHTINCRIGPASVADTGSTFFFGFNAWDAPVCGPYRGPSNLGPYALPVAQEGSELYVQGAPTSMVGWLKRGDIIDLAGAPVVLDVTDQVDTDAAGGAIIPISPPFFKDSYYVSNGVAVVVDPTQITFSAVVDKVQGTPAIDTNQYLDAGLTVTWREVAA